MRQSMQKFVPLKNSCFTWLYLPVVKGILAGENNCTLIVAHAVVNRAIICEALRLPLERAYRIDQAYGGITIIDYGRTHPVLHTVNAPCVPAKFREEKAEGSSPAG